MVDLACSSSRSITKYLVRMKMKGFPVVPVRVMTCACDDLDRGLALGPCPLRSPKRMEKLIRLPCKLPLRRVGCSVGALSYDVGVRHLSQLWSSIILACKFLPIAAWLDNIMTCARYKELHAAAW